MLHRSFLAASFSLALAALGSAATGVKWLAVVTLGLAFYTLILAIATAGPIGLAVGRTYGLGGWRRGVLILGFTAAAALIGFIASEIALAYWNADLVADQERKSREAARDIELSSTRTQLAATEKELSAARARYDAAEAKRQRQSKAFRRVTGRIARAINVGDGVRYQFEHVRNTEPDKFRAEFQSVHAKAIEDWRSETARMLDAELPNLGLGANFSAVTGARVGYGDVYELTRLLACIAKLQSIQETLPTYIEQTVQ